MRKLVAFGFLLALPATAGTITTSTVESAQLAAHVQAIEEAGSAVRFVLPAASRSWTECPVYGCFESSPGGPVFCIDPPEPPEPCPVMTEVLTFHVVAEAP